MRYLLDTNIVSALIRNPHGALAQRVLAVDDSELCTSIIVTAELWYGLTKRNSRRLGFQVESVPPLEPPGDTVYGSLCARIEATGQPIRPNDLLITSQAVAFGLILVTDDARECVRIDELPVGNWLRDD